MAITGRITVPIVRSITGSLVGDSAPAGPQAPAFHALTPDPDTHAMRGVLLGAGDLTPSHTAAIYQPDHEGVYREFAANEPVYKGGRVVFDPTQLFASFKTSSSSPDPLVNFRCNFNDGSTWTGIFGEEHRRNIASGVTQTVAGVAVGADIDVFIGSHAALTLFYFSNNQLTGTIPDISANIALLDLYLSNNQLTDFSGGVANFTSAITFNASNNKLTTTAVNNLLVAFDGSTAVPGTIVLSGGTNAAPTGAGLAAKSSLISKGWTVATNV